MTKSWSAAANYSRYRFTLEKLSKEYTRQAPQLILMRAIQEMGNVIDQRIV